MAKRLVKIAKELNVGTATIVEHLKESGFDIKNKPSAKITDDMYAELLREFQSSISVKEQADQLKIGHQKNVEKERQKEEEEKAKQKEEEEKKDENYNRREFSYTSFQRSFTLPEYADENKINAHYENGVLYVDIPKKEEAKKQEKKKIEIS